MLDVCPDAEIPINEEAVPFIVNEDISNTDVAMQHLSFVEGNFVSCELSINYQTEVKCNSDHIPVMA